MDKAIELYHKMLRIRLVEEALADEYAKQEMKCPMHLYIGQEAVAAGISQVCTPEDALISTHRSHGHYLAKMGALRPMFAELYGRSTGSSKGKGGSMHLLDLDIGYYGSSAIVGGNIPLVAGLALSFQYKKLARMAVAFFGDGAAEEGVLYETLNFSALKKLPVLFVCENNHFSVSTRFEDRQPLNNIYKRAETFGVQSERVDGNDVLAVHAAAKRARAHISEGKGPYFIEAHTYRWRTHCGPQWDAPSSARPREELQFWLDRCPIETFRNSISSQYSDTELNQVTAQIKAEIADAFAFAKSSPYPKFSALQEDIFS